MRATRRSSTTRKVIAVLHLLGVLAWVGLLGASLALRIGLAAYPLDALAVAGLNRIINSLTIWVMIPSVIVVLVTGGLLSVAYRSPKPWWIQAKIALAAVVVFLGSFVVVGLVRNTELVTVARTTGLVALLAAVVLSVYKPGNRQVRTVGRHRR